MPTLARRRGRTATALAPHVRDTVVALGPSFIKLSQIVASSPGLFPPAISESLRELLDDAPPEPWPAIRQQIESGLRRPLSDLFATIEPEPLAAASIAQVHAATRTDGTRVAVKVRRPGVEEWFRTDLRLLRLAAGGISRLSRRARVLNPMGVVDGTIESLAHELDFAQEADAMERFARNLRSFGSNDRVRVPAVHRDLCGPGVLTMERIEGIKVDDLARLELTGLDLVGLLRAGVRAWVESAAEHGFFHGDVHAGNLMLDGEGKVVFLDFGIVGELDEETRRLVRKGVVALLHERDFDEVTNCLIALGVHLAGDVDRERAAAAVRRLAEPLLSKPLSELDYHQVLGDAIRMASPHGVSVPRSLLLLVKQIIYFERYAKLVAPGYDILSDLSLIDFMIEEGVVQHLSDGDTETMAEMDMPVDGASPRPQELVDALEDVKDTPPEEGGEWPDIGEPGGVARTGADRGRTPDDDNDKDPNVQAGGGQHGG